MKNDFVVVSLQADERKKLPGTERVQYKTKTGEEKALITVGDKRATFRSENFNAAAQPPYAILSPDEMALTKTKGYPRANGICGPAETQPEGLRDENQRK